MFHRLIALVFLGFALAGCGEAALTLQEPPPAEPEADDFTLSSGVQPLLSTESNRCTSCHSASAHTSDLVLDGTPSEVRDALIAGGHLESIAYGEDVNLTYPEKSLFVQAGLPGADFTHGGNKFFEDDDDFTYKTFLGWVVNGAKDD